MLFESWLSEERKAWSSASASTSRERGFEGAATGGGVVVDGVFVVEGGGIEDGGEFVVVVVCDEVAFEPQNQPIVMTLVRWSFDNEFWLDRKRRTVADSVGVSLLY